MSARFGVGRRPAWVVPKVIVIVAAALLGAAAAVHVVLKSNSAGEVFGAIASSTLVALAAAYLAGKLSQPSDPPAWHRLCAFAALLASVGLGAFAIMATTVELATRLSNSIEGTGLFGG